MAQPFGFDNGIPNIQQADLNREPPVLGGLLSGFGIGDNVKASQLIKKIGKVNEFGQNNIGNIGDHFPGINE